MKRHFAVYTLCGVLAIFLLARTGFLKIFQFKG